MIVKCRVCSHTGDLKRSDDGWRCSVCAALMMSLAIEVTETEVENLKEEEK